jgi:hypothetical protein
MRFTDDNPPMDAAFMAEMKPSRRGRPKLDAPLLEKNERMASQGKTLSQVLVPAQPQDFEWEPARSTMAAPVPDFASTGVGVIDPMEQKSD